MPATAIDSAIFKDIFGTQAMREVFSDERRVQHYLDIEAALARVQARLGIIPSEAAEEICRHCQVAELDMALLKSQTERIGYPVLPVVQQLVGLCRDGLGEWCHWGATTQDITDTATVLQIRDGLDLVERELRAICAALSRLARRYRDTPMAARSNLQQAVPITFGYKAAVLLAGFQRAAVLFPFGLILVVHAGNVAKARDASGDQVAALPEVVAVAEVAAQRAVRRGGRGRCRSAPSWAL